MLVSAHFYYKRYTTAAASHQRTFIFIYYFLLVAVAVALAVAAAAVVAVAVATCHEDPLCETRKGAAEAPQAPRRRRV